VIDISGLSEGYVSDQTRTFFVRRADPVLLDAYATCRRILHECTALLRPGTPGSAFYERGLEIASQAGHAERFMGAGDGRVKFIGHCIGLELNEPPYLARGYEAPLEEGNVVAIEPKLAFTGLGAVGIENSYLVEADGPLQLTGASEDPVIT
jgi:Xaa-Pro aminopeptidase